VTVVLDPASVAAALKWRASQHLIRELLTVVVPGLTLGTTALVIASPDAIGALLGKGAPASALVVAIPVGLLLAYALGWVAREAGFRVLLLVTRDPSDEHAAGHAWVEMTRRYPGYVIREALAGAPFVEPGGNEPARLDGHFFDYCKAWLSDRPSCLVSLRAVELEINLLCALATSVLLGCLACSASAALRGAPLRSHASSQELWVVAAGLLVAAGTLFAGAVSRRRSESWFALREYLLLRLLEKSAVPPRQRVQLD
jgi:hypothetical protein